MKEKVVEATDLETASEVAENESVKEEKMMSQEGPKYNVKASVIGRIAGGLIDTSLVFMSIFGLSRLFLATPMTNPLRDYEAKINTVIDTYKLTPLVEGSDETVAHKVYKTEEGYTEKDHNVYYDEAVSEYYVVIDNETISSEASLATSKAIKSNGEYKNLSFDYSLMEYGYMALAGFIAYAVFLLIVPLVNKRRATLGKLAAGTMLIDSKYQTRAKWYQVVGRFAWEYLIEAALIYLFLSSMLLHLLIVPTVIFIITLIDRKKGRTLHDFVTRTMVIESKSFLPLSEQ